MLVSTTFYFSVFVAYSTAVPGFTVRRMYENAREEFEKVELLREVNMCEVVRVNGGGGGEKGGVGVMISQLALRMALCFVILLTT